MGDPEAPQMNSVENPVNKASRVHHPLLRPEPGLGAALGWGPGGQPASQLRAGPLGCLS